MTLVRKRGKNRPTGNFKSYFSAATDEVGARNFHQAIDDEVSNFIKDDPICSKAEAEYGTGHEKFMQRLEQELGFSRRTYKRKSRQRLIASGAALETPDTQTKFKYMRSGGNADLAQSCFYLFVLDRDKTDHASNIEERVGISAFVPERAGTVTAMQEERVGKRDKHMGLLDFLMQKTADIGVTAQVASLPMSDGLEIKDHSALSPLAGEQVFHQEDRISFQIETCRNRLLMFLLSDQEGCHWLVPGPSYSGPTRSILERVPSSFGFRLDQIGPHRFIVIELAVVMPIYTRGRYDSPSAVFRQQEDNLINALKNDDSWRWGETFVFVKESEGAKNSE